MSEADAADGGRRGFAWASWANVLGNIAKIVAEGGAGFAFGSVALLADAAHSLADLVASVVVLVWGRSAFDEPDDTHPHGHDRIEPLTALFVGAIIALLGLNLLYRSGRGLLYGTDIEFSPLLLAALGFSIVDMYLVYRYTVAINERLQSTALAALAKDCLNDIYTSVAAIVGVLGVLVGSPILDPVAGGSSVCWSSIRVSRSAGKTSITSSVPRPVPRSEGRSRPLSGVIRPSRASTT